MEKLGKPSALTPLLIFLVIFIGTGVYLTVQNVDMAFYQLSAAVAVLPAIIFAFMQGKTPFEEKMSLFLKGVGDSNIITMCIIYLLAGGFASVASSIGGVDATVHFGLSFIPSSMILPALFLIGSFVATAMGTSMGTIAAITPIAIGISQQTDIGLPILLGVVLSGAMFGDNLSMISDTTIAATKTQGCDMRDKFILNFRIVFPAAIIAFILFYYKGASGVEVPTENYEFIKVVPYIAILALALIGVNVFVVLITGILLSGAVGFATSDSYTLLGFSGDIYKGFAGMNEIMILSMMLGGLGELIKKNGGIAWLIRKVDETAKARSEQMGANANSTEVKNKKRRIGEWSIAFLVGFADICVANNTVAIILTGGVSKEIAEKNDVDPRRAASILDIVSCVFQGILPYAAQLLLAGSIAKISPVEVAINNWYCIILAFFIIMAIATGFPNLKDKKS